MEKKRGKKKAASVAAKIYVILLFIFIYAPVVVMIVFSFNDSRANVVWSGFTLKYYKKLFADSGIWEVFGTTLLIQLLFLKSFLLLPLFLYLICQMCH